MSLPEFKMFPKIKRISYGDCIEMIVTEKIDGTNGQIYIDDHYNVFAGSRNRWLTPQDDNFGFCAWVYDNKDELIEKLGKGHHYGEWWGPGIQRRYNTTKKQFSLFNVSRWSNEYLGDLCSTVPILFKGPFKMSRLEHTINRLNTEGSVIAPGFMRPEGVVAYFSNFDQCLKFTFEGKNGKRK